MPPNLTIPSSPRPGSRAAPPPSPGSAPPPTPTHRRAVSQGKNHAGSLYTEPEIATQTWYEGALTRDTIASRCGKRTTNHDGHVGGPQSQAYGSAFRSGTPRFSKPTREQALVPMFGQSGGPSFYTPFGDQALAEGTQKLSTGSMSWTNRGRAGPVGRPIEVEKRSRVFRSDVSRWHYTAKPPPLTCRPMTPRDHAFVLRSDDSVMAQMRTSIATSLQTRVLGQGHYAPFMGRAVGF